MVKMGSNDWSLRAWIEWFKGEAVSNKKLPEKSESQLVSESLLHELDCAIKETEERNYQREQEERKRTQKVDYSWLIDPTRVSKYSFEISQGERMEIESLCWQILPTECNKVIMQFREYLSREPMVQEIPVLFRACLTQTIQSRPAMDGESAMGSHLEKVKRSNKVMPFAQSMIDMRSRRNSQEMQMRMPIKFSTLDVRTLPV
ncbi:protein RD3-like [Paramacrobiotus metropolitanus]|uniref:protein RD3-like n=1 Tax=Paramacrobiotus metropolitanus TaxID=2943436 RepID=UPI002445A652|nr:protein RD3-like [Paramacrobiotus metropolitanus]